MKDDLTIKGFYLQNRQIGSNGNAKSVEIQISNNGSNWETVLTKTNLPNVATRQEFLLENKVTARYIRYLFSENSHGGVFAAIAEMGTFDID